MEDKYIFHYMYWNYHDHSFNRGKLFYQSLIMVVILLTIVNHILDVSKTIVTMIEICDPGINEFLSVQYAYSKQFIWNLVLGGRMTTKSSKMTLKSTCDLGAQYISLTTEYAQKHQRYVNGIVCFVLTEMEILCQMWNSSTHGWHLFFTFLIIIVT